MTKVALYANDTVKLIDVFSNILILRNDEFAPVYKSGDAIGVEHVEDIQPGEVGAYFINDELFIKIRGLGVLRSIDPVIPDVHIDANVRLAGRVMRKV